MLCAGSSKCTEDLDCIWNSLVDRVKDVVNTAINNALDQAALDQLKTRTAGLRNIALHYNTTAYPICGSPTP